MSITIPFAHQGAEFIAEAVSTKHPHTNEIAYFFKINGDPACFVNYAYGPDAKLFEESSSDDLTPEFKASLKYALVDYLASNMGNS